MKMKILKNCVLFISLALCFDQSIAADSACGDWASFKDQHCYKIFESSGLQTFENAEKVCHQNSATLIRIQTKEEQDFLTNYLFKVSKIVDNVWIGAKFANGKFKWEDNSELTFTNWAEGRPKNAPSSCVQLHTDLDSAGKWVDDLCQKKNLVVCQKIPTLSLARLQDMLVELKQNPVPIGFIYTQLPNEKAPDEIWPWMTWTDITYNYAGVFFRVGGGMSGQFGQIQEENSPRLSRISLVSLGSDEVHIAPGESHAIYTGDRVPSETIDGARGRSRSFAFFVSPGEVRPRNMAVKVWKRSG